ncbi:MAG: pentapeptide repeat-containing protein, partial [Rickettsia endosymbiont of Ixodes persulcatus]|nr:pentapeptide repeat-containing protein [Rickettsia endosymbiont of Ixodes persulcatus]
AKFDGCNFIDTIFSKSILSSVSFKDITIESPSDFKLDQHTQLSTDSFTDIYQAIPSEKRETFRKEIFKGTDLRLIDFQEFFKTAGADSLIGFSFSDSDLALADLSNFKLNRVDFSRSIIDNVIFDNAFLRDTNFEQASLQGASLNKIRHDSVFTIFKDKSLQGTKFSTPTFI